jgi:type III secretory pathway component EscT
VDRSCNWAIAKSVVTWLSIAALLLIGVVITMVIYEAGLIIVHPVSAQTNSTTTTTGNGFSKFPPEDN